MVSDVARNRGVHLSMVAPTAPAVRGGTGWVCSWFSSAIGGVGTRSHWVYVLRPVLRLNRPYGARHTVKTARQRRSPPRLRARIKQGRVRRDTRQLQQPGLKRSDEPTNRGCESQACPTPTISGTETL